MATTDETYEAIGIHDSADGKCGIALLLLSMRERPDQIYLLDPRSGPKPLLSREELDEMKADDGVCLFVDPMTVSVSGLDYAFFIHPELQKVYTEITGKEISSDGPKLVKASLNVLVGIAPRADLVKWRVALAEEMLKEMDREVIRALAGNRDEMELESQLKKMEHWGRSGALCAGLSSLKLYQQWMKRVGVAMFLQPDQHERLHLTFEMMVEQVVPDSHYEAFIEQVKILWASWSARVDFLKKSVYSLGQASGSDMILFDVAAVSRNPRAAYENSAQRVLH